MNKFIEAFDEVTNFGYTENGALKRTSTGDYLIDMFGQIGAMRNREDNEITSLFRFAYNEDKALAVKMMFYARNCRGGLGERKTFRIILRWMANHHPNAVRANLQNVPFYGRWDDLYELIATPCESDMWQLVRLQWIEDAANLKRNKPISIMAKWLKSVNCSNEKSCGMGRKTARELGLSEAQYRKALSKMRAYLRVCERTMSDGEWQKIVYSEVPSYAMQRYKAAFYRHDSVRFNQFKADLEKKIENGTITSDDIKSTVMYPYDLVREYIGYGGYARLGSRYGDGRVNEYNTIVEAQWKALPNYVEGENNVVVMADVSGSMFTDNLRPISSSIGLAIYFAERNHGAFAGKYMTFSRDPQFFDIKKGASLNDNVKQVMGAGVGYYTDLQSGFEAILNMAVRNHVPAEDMPKALVVISDMEINPYQTDPRRTDFVTAMARRFSSAGYTMPKLVMWNVEARQNTFHGKATNPYVQFVSGSSASSFRDLLGALECDAYGMMIKTLNNPIYDRVVTEF